MYKVVLKKKADKHLKLLDRNSQLKILDLLKTISKRKLETLDIKKLKWYENRYRLRVWKYRILFEKYEDKLIILVIDIWSRWDVYK